MQTFFMLRHEGTPCSVLSCLVMTSRRIRFHVVSLHDVTTSLVMSDDTTRLNLTLHDVIHCITDQNVSIDVAPIPEMSLHAGSPLVKSGR